MAWTLITGGAKGLGAAICLALAKNGYPILVHYNTSHSEASHVVDECRRCGVAAEKIQGDFSTAASTRDFIDRLEQQFSPIKNLINNVGNYLIKSPLETSEEEWDQIFRSNLHVPFVLTRSLIGGIKQEQGSIINLGVAGINAGRADTYSTAYTTAKFSLWLLTKSLAKELAPHLVRVNMVSPGYLETSIDLPKNMADIPMKRLANFEEVARVVVFLLAEENKYLTAQNIEVAGGLRL